MAFGFHTLLSGARVLIGRKVYTLFDLMLRTIQITHQEYRVLKLIGNGFSSKQIAVELYISFHTAETHRRHLLHKFDARNSAELMKKATKEFWL